MATKPGVSVDVALRAGAALGEGPVWDPIAQTLIWVDIEGRLVHRYDPVSATDRSARVSGRVGFAAPRAGGGLVLAMEHSFVLLDEDGAGETEMARVELDAPTRMNDGNCDSAGRLYAGTMALDERSPVGALYRLDPDGSVERVLDGVVESNGLDWSTDGDTMYYIDSATRSLDAFDFETVTGRLSGRRRIVQFAPEDGTPDGLSVDSEGLIWIAFWGGWSVRRHTPDGALVGAVSLPAAHVTSCAFGGEALDDLYITSATEGLSTPELTKQPDAGSLFRHRPGVTGRPQNAFAG
jgi:sugar lactone lactonase YvrE